MHRCTVFCLFTLVLVGCGGTTTTSPSSETVSSGSSAPPSPPRGSRSSGKEHDANVSSSGATPSFDDILGFWQDGDQDRAAREFLSVTHWDTLKTATDSVFAVSEQKFMAASRSRQAELMEQLTQSNQMLRQLARHLVDAAKNEADATKASDILSQVEACGTWLQDPSRTRQVQQLGKGLSMAAARQKEQSSEK